MRLLFFFLVSLFLSAAVACSTNADCGSADDSAPGLCQAGICQCGVGYSGNLAIDPTSCSLTCSPAPVPDSVAFLREPNVTVGASAGNLVLDVGMEPYGKQTPATVALLNPRDGTSCPLMAAELGTGKWTQEILNDVSQCFSRYVYASPFAASVGQQCWETLAPTVESGSQYSITFNQYATQVEVIQKGLAPFGQAAARSVLRDDVLIERALRRNYTISVATQFKPNSAPFTLIAEPPVAPTAVDDVISTPQNVPKTIDVTDNDIEGYQNVDGVQVPRPLVSGSLSIIVQPTHGSVAISEGQVVYTPANLYHGPDSFQYRICDAGPLCDNATVSIVVTPDPPVAADDAAKCDFESSVTVQVLNNDVAGVGGLVTLSIESGPANGTASITESNEIKYDAAPGFAGIVSLVYEICDGSNPTVLCDTATVQVDVDGTGPVAVDDAAIFAQNGASASIDVLDNDLAGTEALNASSVVIKSAPSHGSIGAINAATGEIEYTPAAGYHGSDVFSYTICDVATPPKCDDANVVITITPSGPTANDDSVNTAYSEQVSIPVLNNDVAGAQPLQPASVTIASPPSNGAAIVNPYGSITYTFNAGFVGSDSLTYSVCDNSTPTPLCDTATVTIVVQPRPGAGIQYRLVTIDYDILGNAIAATVQTRTSSAAKVANVQLNLGASTGLSAVLSLTEGTACDAGSPVGSCDQFHVIKFSDEPCEVANAEMVLTASFLCSDGSIASSCGFQAVQSVFTLNQLILNYDACPRIVEYGIDSANSFLRLHDDVPRAVPVSAPALQGSTLYGRCSVLPTAGSTFQSVTLSAMHVFQAGGANGPIDLGDQISAGFMSFASSLVSNSPTNPIWDFDLVMDPTFFSIANTYYLEATLDLTFANTGPLTRSLRINLVNPAPAKPKMLRAALSKPNVVQLVAISGRAPTDNEQQQGVASNTFNLRAAEEEATTSAASSGSSDTAMIAGIAGVVGAALIALVVVVAVVVRKHRQGRERAGSDAPLRVTQSTDEMV